jgi:hypothetical protein
MALAAAALLLGTPAEAQSSALASGNSPNPVIVYSRNESGGRISLSFPGADSTTMERHRLQLLELAAAIRRGDFRAVWVIQPNHPAVQVLARARDKLRCTLRQTSRGAELVLLSDDDNVIAAIHQILSSTPPRSVRL